MNLALIREKLWRLASRMYHRRQAPMSKQLGNFMQEWIAIRRLEVEGRGPEMQMLAHRLEALEDGQTRLLENLAFHEELADESKPVAPHD